MIGVRRFSPWQIAPMLPIPFEQALLEEPFLAACN